MEDTPNPSNLSNLSNPLITTLTRMLSGESWEPWLSEDRTLSIGVDPTKGCEVVICLYRTEAARIRRGADGRYHGWIRTGPWYSVPAQQIDELRTFLGLPVPTGSVLSTREHF